MEEKENKSPLSEPHEAALAMMVDRLSALPQGISVLYAEDEEGFVGPDADGRYWLVEPLDGNKEFIKRNGEFTVNIALIEKGKPVLGVVIAPGLGRTYLAAEGLGAVKVDQHGTRHTLTVAVKPVANTPWRVVGSRSHPSPNLAEWLEKFGVARDAAHGQLAEPLCDRRRQGLCLLPFRADLLVGHGGYAGGG